MYFAKTEKNVIRNLVYLISQVIMCSNSMKIKKSCEFVYLEINKVVMCINCLK